MPPNSGKMCDFLFSSEAPKKTEPHSEHLFSIFIFYQMLKKIC